MEKYLLSVDNGGTYIKAVILNTKGEQIALAKDKNCIEHPGPNMATVDQEKMWQIDCSLIKEVLKESRINPSQIACVGFAGQGKGLYTVDKDGKSFMLGRTSSDSRAKSYADLWKNDGTDEKLYSKIYQVASGGKPHSILRQIKDNDRDNYDRIAYVFSMKDFLVYRMTGNPIGGMSAMSGTNLVNLDTKQYDKSLFEAYGIEEMFDKMPPLKFDYELAGYVSKEASLQCGLDEGTPVSCGMFDVNASAIAMGVTNDEPVIIITGTHGINAYLSEKPVGNGTVKLNSIYPVDGYYQIEEGYPASSGSLEWVLDRLYGSEHGDIYDEVNKLVESVDPAASKVMFMPYFSGWRDDKKASACFFGLKSEHNNAHMLRAVYEGVVFSHCLQIDHLLANRPKPDKFLMAGGATNSAVWVQMFADVLQTAIQLVPAEEMGAKGVAIMSSVTAGIYQNVDEAVRAMCRPGEIVLPNPDKAEVYQDKLNNYKKMMEAMTDLWRLF